MSQTELFPSLSLVDRHTSLAYSEEGTPFIAYYFENSNGVDALMLLDVLSHQREALRHELPRNRVSERFVQPRAAADVGEYGCQRYALSRHRV